MHISVLFFIFDKRLFIQGQSPYFTRFKHYFVNALGIVKENGWGLQKIIN